MSDSTQDYLILFADLIGSTEVAAEVRPSFYSCTYVASYHWCARRALAFIQDKTVFTQDTFSKTIPPLRIAGDEVLSFAELSQSGESKKEDEDRDIVGSAVAFAWVLKLLWLASPYNLQRMLDRQFPRDIAVGIHSGPAAPVPDMDQKDENQIASLHINLAKRIESESREGGESRIFASSDVQKRFATWLKKHDGIPAINRPPLAFARFGRSDPRVLKGISKKINVAELFWDRFGNQSDFDALFGTFAVTPKNVDSDSEAAAVRLAETFFGTRTKPFHNWNDEPAIYAECLVDPSVVEYIGQWFEAVSKQSDLFFDERWLVLNCFIISSAFLRLLLREKPDHSEEEKYQTTTAHLWERFKGFGR